MKSIIFFSTLLISIFVISCDIDHKEPLMPATEILSISTSANSAVITWKDVSADFYTVSIYKPKYPNWWYNNKDYYQIDDKNPILFYVGGERWDKYPLEFMVSYEIDSIYETSITFDNLEKSTVYAASVLTRGYGISGDSDRFFFRTKDE
jgi:hypothetical protein